MEGTQAAHRLGLDAGHSQETLEIGEVGGELGELGVEVGLWEGEDRS